MLAQWATEQEIASQPDIWSSWADELARQAEAIRQWISARSPNEIWLSGAGTSAFIGDSIVTSLEAQTENRQYKAVASTDLVACPGAYVRKDGEGILVVSFGRSGNSSESVGTLNVLDAMGPKADRLHITCNSMSTLSTRPHAGPGEQRVILLPEGCHDRGFAMTSSYTTMLLTALACLGADPIDKVRDNLAVLSSTARDLLETTIEAPRPERCVFLGSGPFTGTARESALKVLELTAGQTITSWDSCLGFRHGPKAVMNDSTAVYVYLSSDPLTRRYDEDVAAEIRAQYPEATVTTIGPTMAEGPSPDISLTTGIEDHWNTALYVLVAQRLAVAWSKDLGLNVDNPFDGGNLTRVVSNVQLYL